MTDLAASYAQCARLARRSASSFYPAFWLLPRRKRRAMCALYAFLRRADDLGDDPALDATAACRRAALERLRAGLVAAANLPPGGLLPPELDDPLLPAVADTLREFRIPLDILSAVIDGVEMDVAGVQYERFLELQLYCYRVASVVGLACVHIWGYRDDDALGPAVMCGLAFQLTNILRDLQADARDGRIYLPLEELRRFGVTPADLRAGVRNAAVTSLMRFQVQRAEEFYRDAAELYHYLTLDGRRVFSALFATYHSLLTEIGRRAGDVVTGRIRLGRLRKLRIIARALVAPRIAAAATWEAAAR